MEVVDPKRPDATKRVKVLASDVAAAHIKVAKLGFRVMEVPAPASGEALEAESDEVPDWPGETSRVVPYRPRGSGLNSIREASFLHKIALLRRTDKPDDRKPFPELAYWSQVLAIYVGVVKSLAKIACIAIPIGVVAVQLIANLSRAGDWSEVLVAVVGSAVPAVLLSLISALVYLLVLVSLSTLGIVAHAGEAIRHIAISVDADETAEKGA